MSIFQVAVDTVNYKLTSEKFIKLKETFGFIENTSDALIEFAITTGEPVFNDKGNQLVIPNGKLSYELEEGQGIYARPVDRLSGEINVSEVKIKSEGGGGVDIGDVVATVDNNVGTPSVEVVSSTNPSTQKLDLKFNFKNIKGAKGNDGATGAKGADGKSAEIVSVTAEINTVEGEPTVQVEEGGTNLAKTLNFIFGIPLSESGGGTSITDVLVNVDDGVGVPSAEGRIEGTTLILDFHNLKGAQGIQGEKGADGKSAFNSDGKIEYPNGTLEWIG